MLRIDTPRASRSVHEMSTVSSDDMMGDLTSSDMEAPGSSLLTPDPDPPAPRRSSQSADEAQRALIELIDDVQHGELDYISSASELARTWYSLIKGARAYWNSHVPTVLEKLKTGMADADGPGDGQPSPMYRLGRDILGQIDEGKEQECYERILLWLSLSKREIGLDQDTRFTEAAEWETLALILVEVKGGVLTPSLSEINPDPDDLRVATYGKNNLHLAIHHACVRLSRKMIQGIMESSNYDGDAGKDLRHKLLLARTSDGNSYLSLAMLNLDFDTMHVLLRAERKLIELGDYETSGSLHSLVYAVYAFEGTQLPTAADCCQMIDDIVSIQNKVLVSGFIGKKYDNENLDKLRTPPLKFISWLQSELHKQRQGTVTNRRLGDQAAMLALIEQKSDVLDKMRIRIEDLIWTHFEGQDMKQAGLDRYDQAELNLADFDIMDAERQTSSLKEFVNVFRPKDGVVEFPDKKLSRLELPNMALSSSTAMVGPLTTLFDALHDEFHVGRIVRLIARDSINDPLDEEQIANWVARFNVELLDWHKMNIDIKQLTDGITNWREKNREAAVTLMKPLRTLHLYTAGHYGILYHWLSPKGLFAMEGLESAIIHIQQKDPSLAEATKCKNIQNSAEVMRDETKEHMKNLGRDNIPDIHISPQLVPHTRRPIRRAEESVTMQFFSPIKEAHDDILEYLRCKEPDGIVIGLLDNGVSLGVGEVSGCLIGGDSVVYVDNRKVPWYTSKDNHGTHMADLITRVNPLCKLRAIRINTFRGDVWEGHAVQGLERVMSMKPEPDIISLSWTVPQVPLRKGESESLLTECLNTLSHSDSPPLVFCAKPELPYGGNSYPADCMTTISVAMASRRPSAPSAGAGPDLLLLGEDVEVESPAYAVQQDGAVSGSSVSTALAAGLASLLLAYARATGVGGPGEWRRLKKRNNMLALFTRFKTDQKSPLPYVDPKRLLGNLDALHDAMADILNIDRGT